MSAEFTGERVIPNLVDENLWNEHIARYAFASRLSRNRRVLDAGCGSGRNLVYLLQSGVEVFATDADSGSIDHVRKLAATLSPDLPAANFRVEPVERMTFADSFADVVISSAVLHFARDHDQFAAMVAEMWRVLKPRGMLFARLASSIGMESRVSL